MDDILQCGSRAIDHQRRGTKAHPDQRPPAQPGGAHAVRAIAIVVSALQARAVLTWLAFLKARNP